MGQEALTWRRQTMIENISPKRRKQLKRYAPLAGGVVLVGLWIAVLILGPTFLVLIVSVVFVGTFVLVPLLAYVVGESAPGFIAEPLAALIVSVGLGGLGKAIMDYSGGEYTKRLTEDDEEYPDDAFYSVGLGELAFVYDRDNGDLEAWTDDVDVDTLGDLDQSQVAPGKVDAGTKRNGLREFIDTKTDPEKVFVYAAEILSRWRDSASIEDAHIGENKARQEHSKEASSTDRTLGDRVEWFLLFVTGVSIGWIFFF